MIPIVIPTLNPTNNIIVLVNELRKICSNHIIIVNDGSSDSCESIFMELKTKQNLTILTHDINRGKGRALKTAFEYFLNNFHEANGVVTADGDGQHMPQDILNIANCLENNSDRLFLGVRDFSGENIPWKSQFGNNLTKKILSLVIGRKLSDTQTGLRGIPTTLIRHLINTPGDRFEFETRMLLEAAKINVLFDEVVIETVYEDNNSGTHFRPIVDSAKIYGIILKFIFEKIILFTISGLLSAVVDIALFSLLFYSLLLDVPGKLILSVAIARAFSLIFNFLMNKNFVFKNKTSNSLYGGKFAKYLGLCGIIMALSYLFTKFGIKIAPNIEAFIIKFIVDSMLFFLSFYVQKFYIFNKNNEKEQQ